MTALAAPVPLPQASMAQTSDPRPLLFCPFCRECFEGEKECPEHELALVPFEQLPKEEDPEALPAHDQPVAPYDPRFGRGLVMGGIVLSSLGFALPVLHVITETQTRSFSGFEAAATRAPNLWTVPFVAAMFVWILARRRTPIAMLGARLVGMVCALAPLLSIAYTFLKVTAAAREMEERSGQLMEIGVAWGAWVIAAGALLLLVGSARLGVVPTDKASRGVAERLRSP